jgi:hypothetical protein
MESVEDVWNVVYYFWGALFWIIKQLLSEDNRQDKLIELLLKIQGQPPPLGEGRTAFEGLYRSSRFWKDLPRWRAA